MKVLHVLETSTPELVGYTIRGAYIVNHQRRLGLDPCVVTSPFYRGATTQAIDQIDGTSYFRSNHIRRPAPGQGKLAAYFTRLRMLDRYRRFVADVARRERADILHAHSSYTNGIAANYASKQLGIPFVYELRTLWGESAVVEDGLDPHSLKYRAIWRFELGVMRNANRVVAISQGIRDAIVERGIDPEKISIVPNGVDTAVFAPLAADEALAETLGMRDSFVVGFIGSLRRLEGLDLLVEAVRNARARNSRIKLVVVGDGPERLRLQRLAQEAGLGSAAIFTGTVPHAEVRRYYSIMNVLVYPRIDARINQTVTPLKPLEAMSMGKPCLASDVGGLRELVVDGTTGLLFPCGDAGALAGKILALAAEPDLLAALAARGQAWVRREREWSSIAARYADVYEAAKA